jgi:hypothetical protein
MVESGGGGDGDGDGAGVGVGVGRGGREARVVVRSRIPYQAFLLVLVLDAELS